MASRNPDFAALAEAAYGASERAAMHLWLCGSCDGKYPMCKRGQRLMEDYRTKKDKALKALRGRKK